jgi:hypothetical protein
MYYLNVILPNGQMLRNRSFSVYPYVGYRYLRAFTGWVKVIAVNVAENTVTLEKSESFMGARSVKN